MVKDWRKYPNFAEHEFACKCGCGQANVSEFLVQKLQLVSDFIAKVRGKRIPIIIVRGCSCPKHNATIKNSSPTSSHVATDDKEGTAVDIRIANSTERFWIVRACYALNFRRHGMYNGHNGYHVDVDLTKDQDVFWKV